MRLIKYLIVFALLLVAGSIPLSFIRDESIAMILSIIYGWALTMFLRSQWQSRKR